MYVLNQVTELEEENKGLREYTENLRRLALIGNYRDFEREYIVFSRITSKICAK